MAQKNFADAMNQFVNGTNGLKSMINVKADKNSPALTGTPTAPTPDNDTDSGQIATTEFCQNLIRRLCGVDTETIALLADLANALLNQEDFREAVVEVLDSKLNKTDAANTYATKDELDDIDIDTSNFAELNAKNTFTGSNTFTDYVVSQKGFYLQIPYNASNISGLLLERRNAADTGYINNGEVRLLSNSIQIRYNSTSLCIQDDGVYVNGTKIA